MQMTSRDDDRLVTGAFLRLWSFGFITFLAAFQLLPTIPLRIIELGGTKSEAGWFLAIYTYASAVSAPITGALADHLGRRRLLLAASASFIVFSLLYAIVIPLPLLLAVGCIHGAIWSAILSSSAALITDMVPDSRRTTGIAYWGMASTSAVAIAPWLGIVVYRYGWWILCVEMAALSVVMVILALRVEGKDAVVTGPMPPLRSSIDPRVFALATTLFAASFGYGGVTSFAALLSRERAIHPESLFFTVFAITILVTRLFTAPIGDRLGPRALLYPSLAAIPVSLVMLAFASTRGELIASAIVFGASFGSAYPAFASYILSKTDPVRRGSTFGSIILAFDTGIGTGSLVLGVVAERASFRMAFLCAACVSLLAIPLFVYLSRRLFERNRGTSVA